jgi:hypothetical protein
MNGSLGTILLAGPFYFGIIQCKFVWASAQAPF